jgi:hypothetical protein
MWAHARILLILVDGSVGEQTWEPSLGKCAVRLNDSSADKHGAIGPWSNMGLAEWRAGGLVLAWCRNKRHRPRRIQTRQSAFENIAIDRLWPRADIHA